MSPQVAALQKCSRDPGRRTVCQIAFETSPARVEEAAAVAEPLKALDASSIALPGGASAKGRDGPVMARAPRSGSSFRLDTRRGRHRCASCSPARKAEGAASVCVDSLTGKGSRFLSRRPAGERTDGHAFLAQAAAAGAVPMLVSDAQGRCAYGEIERIAKKAL